MLIDLSKNDTIKAIRSELCIIGAGAAGITIAKEFNNKNVGVSILESGELEHNDEVQSLYDGNWLYKGLGQIYESTTMLRESRLRQFGGSTGHWGGFCSTFDDIDFEKREWVNNSGWPFKLDTLKAYYDKAADLLEIPRFDYDLLPNYNPDRPPLVLDKDYSIQTKMIHFSDVRFASRYRQDIEESENLTAYLNASVLKIRLDKSGKTVSHLEVSVKGMRKIRVFAKYFILACGGIENVRALLVSNDVHKNGIGNENDLVGRFFQGHVHQTGKIFGIHMPIDEKKMDLYYRRNDRIKEKDTAAFLRMSNSLQRQHRVLNCIIGVGLWSEPFRETGPNFRSFKKEYADMLEDLGLKKTGRQQWYTRYCQLFLEQEPNYSSTVTLSEEKDWLGVRKCRVDVQITELQRKTMIRTMKTLGLFLGASARGKTYTISDNQSLFRGIAPPLGFHHIGTTRISDYAKDGVVNKDCRVHSVRNLYIAGSSVFPTSGAVNPTLTIVSMSIRLADHIKTLSLLG